MTTVIWKLREATAHRCWQYVSIFILDKARAKCVQWSWRRCCQQEEEWIWENRCCGHCNYCLLCEEAWIILCLTDARRCQKGRYFPMNVLKKNKGRNRWRAEKLYILTCMSALEDTVIREHQNEIEEIPENINEQSGISLKYSIKLLWTMSYVGRWA